MEATWHVWLQHRNAKIVASNRHENHLLRATFAAWITLHKRCSSERQLLEQRQRNLLRRVMWKWCQLASTVQRRKHLLKLADEARQERIKARLLRRWKTMALVRITERHRNNQAVQTIFQAWRTHVLARQQLNHNVNVMQLERRRSMLLTCFQAWVSQCLAARTARQQADEMYRLRLFNHCKRVFDLFVIQLRKDRQSKESFVQALQTRSNGFLVRSTFHHWVIKYRAHVEGRKLRRLQEIGEGIVQRKNMSMIARTWRALRHMLGLRQLAASTHDRNLLRSAFGSWRTLISRQTRFRQKIAAFQ